MIAMQSRRRPIRRGATAVLAAVAAATLLVAVPSPASALGGEGEAWPSFNESGGCGAQRARPSHAAESGWLSKDTLIRGEAGAYFGRTVRQVLDGRVLWQLPGSSKKLAIHERIVDALDAASEAIEAHMAEFGVRYRIKGSSTYSTAARTIAGSTRISRHTHGIAFDINASYNPYRGNNKLITNLPPWWRNAFIDAGFCWGGLWFSVKDTMHFAWQGPAFSDYASLPPSYDPLTDPVDFTYPDRIWSIVPQEPRHTIATVLADMDSSGALDVARIVVDGADLRIVSSVASTRHNACSLRSATVQGIGMYTADALGIGLGDWDGLGGSDLWVAVAAGDRLRLIVRYAYTGYMGETSSLTDVPTPSPDAWMSTADYDSDGSLDLFIFDHGTLSVWSIDPGTGATSRLHSVDLSVAANDQIFLGDRNLDQRPDLWTLGRDGGTVRLAADGYAGTPEAIAPSGLPDELVDVAAADYDGDGRRDLITFDGRTKRVWLGNTPMPDGQRPERWFEVDEPECDRTGPIADVANTGLSFSSLVSEGSYAWRRDLKLPVGCDPEDEDCPRSPVTNEQLVEFMAWAANLDPDGLEPGTAAVQLASQADLAMPCTLDDGACWAANTRPDVLDAIFTLFLFDRSPTTFVPHQWFIPAGVVRLDAPDPG